ncbi:hypothetical protein [Verminephrobacter eiseniae]|uniref:hypothetical protein n=1 Tax=Verminephrobacter eiseniae TaxID=364317 RepID=UPI002237FA6E|nr:hypothetical protein [Verminephrobacter eiseniae]MCW5235642.1 hypothetical protein [Verminephrobacter eiseniae]
MAYAYEYSKAGKKTKLTWADGTATGYSYFLYADEGLIAETTQAITINADQSISASTAPTITTQYGPRPDSEFMTGVLFIKTKNGDGMDVVA